METGAGVGVAVTPGGGVSIGGIEVGVWIGDVPAASTGVLVVANTDDTVEVAVDGGRVGVGAGALLAIAIT